MLTNLYSTITLLLFLLFINNSNSQNILTHNTGTVAVSMFDHGYIGHNANSTTGSGVIFTGGPDAIRTAGFVAAYSYTKVVGAVGFFMQDWVNAVPYGSFTSNSNFNQIATASYNDSNAPVANRIGLSVIQTSLSNIGDDFIIIEYTITNNSGSAITGFHAGAYADWDVGNYLLNRGGYDLSRNLAYQFENGGANDTKYYGLVALNGLAGAKVIIHNFVPYRDSVFQWISTFLNQPVTTNGDHITFIGSGPYNLGNEESVKVGLAVVAGISLADLQANSENAQTKWNNIVVPVELTSFTAIVNPLGQAVLNWVTATEINNRGFEVERKAIEGQFATIGFVEGFGTTSQEKTYTFVDDNVNPGSFVYRLKQIDFNGHFEYSDEVQINVTGPLEFALEQNYPNPFNPSTTIKYSLAKTDLIRLSIYNILGQEIQVLLNEIKEAGFYEINFDASSLPSGTYLYKINAPQFTETKKMLLMK